MAAGETHLWPPSAADCNDIADDRKDDMKLLNIAMSNTANSILRLLNAGYLIRGGATFGAVYFDELGFFGPAVEKAYELESSYADVPVIAIEPELGEKLYAWEDANTAMELVNLLMTSRVRLIEKDKNKFYLNLFYQLEAFSPVLSFEQETLSLDSIKNALYPAIMRDKKKYTESYNGGEKKKSTVYEKLDWFEKYLNQRHNRLRIGTVGLSGVFGDL